MSEVIRFMTGVPFERTRSIGTTLRRAARSGAHLYAMV
jgi:hypothetical protein